MHPCFLSAAPGRGRRIRGRSLGKSDEKKDAENGIFRLSCNHYTLEEARRIVIEALIRPIIDGMDPSVRDEIITELRQKLDSKEL